MWGGSNSHNHHSMDHNTISRNQGKKWTTDRQTDKSIHNPTDRPVGSTSSTSSQGSHKVLAKINAFVIELHQCQPINHSSHNIGNTLH